MRPTGKDRKLIGVSKIKSREEKETVKNTNPSSNRDSAIK